MVVAFREMFCCACDEVSQSNTVVVIPEPTGNEHTPEDDVKKEVEVDKKRKAEEEAAAAQKQRALVEESRKKREAEEEEARQRQEALKLKQEEEEEEESRKRKEAADMAVANEAAAREAAATEEAAKGLPLTFRDASGKKTYTVNFQTKPLGIDFNENATPVKVTQAFGAAKKVGVSVGSCLINIAGTDVEKLGFGDMLAVLKEKIAPLTPDGLTIDFKDASGQLHPIVFPTKPLGMDFDNGKQPIQIKAASGAARSLGVEAGWELSSIAGTNVEKMDFDQMVVLLRAKIEALPTKD